MVDYLLQQGREVYFQMLDVSAPIHRAYARRHRMQHVIHWGAVLPELPGFWDSVKLLLDLVREPYTEYVFWLDADTLIVGDDDPRDVLDGYLVGMARHPGPPEHYNCGVLFLKACPQVADWLERVLQSAPGVYPWYQQNFMNEYLNEPQWAGLVKTLPDTWNSTVVLKHPADCIIRAWHGYPGDRAAAMRAEGERRGLWD